MGPEDPLRGQEDLCYGPRGLLRWGILRGKGTPSNAQGATFKPRVLHSLLCLVFLWLHLKPTFFRIPQHEAIPAKLTWGAPRGEEYIQSPL